MTHEQEQAYNNAFRDRNEKRKAIYIYITNNAKCTDIKLREDMRIEQFIFNKAKIDLLKAKLIFCQTEKSANGFSTFYFIAKEFKQETKNNEIQLGIF